MDYAVDSGNVFNQFQLAIDGKLYISSGSGEKYLGVIDSPDQKGHRCRLRQAGLKLLTYNQGISHFPNYKLGADSCGMHSSLSMNEDHPEITIYPNPAQEEIRVSISSILYKHFLTNDVTIHIFDINGRSVFQMKISKHQTDDVRIEITKLPNGVYYLECIDSKNFLSQKKNFIISR